MGTKIMDWSKIEIVGCAFISILLIITLFGVDRIGSYYYGYLNGNKIERESKIYNLDNSGWYIVEDIENSYTLKSLTNENNTISITIFKQNNFYPKPIYDYWDSCRSIVTQELGKMNKIIICLPNIESGTKTSGMALLDNNNELIAMTLEYNPVYSDRYASVFQVITDKP